PLLTARGLANETQHLRLLGLRLVLDGNRRQRVLRHRDVLVAREAHEIAFELRTDAAELKRLAAARVMERAVGREVHRHADGRGSVTGSTPPALSCSRTPALRRWERKALATSTAALRLITAAA